MASSLKKLVSATDKANFKIARGVLGDKTGVVLRKGVYPYEYIDSLDRFNEPRLPPIETFYGKLTDEKITQDDYDYT